MHHYKNKLPINRLHSNPINPPPPVKPHTRTPSDSDTPSSNPAIMETNVIQPSLPVIQTVQQSDHTHHTDTISIRGPSKPIPNTRQQTRQITTLGKEATNQDRNIQGKRKPTTDPKVHKATKRTKSQTRTSLQTPSPENDTPTRSTLPIPVPHRGSHSHPHL